MKNVPFKICIHHGQLTMEQMRPVKGKSHFDCKLCLADRAKRYAAKYPEKKFAYNSQWSKDNKNKYKIYRKKCWQKHHDQNIKRSREKYQMNKEKLSQYNLAVYHADPDIASHRRLMRIFNMSLDEYNTLLIKQNHCCAICKKPETILDKRQGLPRKLAVDHCHQTKKNRGLLCFRCNTILGHAQDSIETLKNAIKYLSKN